MEDIKSFNIRIPKDLWMFLRHQSIEQEKYMNQIIVTVLKKYQEKIEKKIAS